jgi:predicted Fe-S protein YdhL (DUF1289 family)
MNIATPCIKICRLDDRGMCVGCRRTAEEITNWLYLTETQRKLIIASLPQRRTELAANELESAATQTGVAMGKHPE